jgi:transposase
MIRYKKSKKDEGRPGRAAQKVALFVGIDLHRVTWHVTIRTEDHELFSGGIPGRWEGLKRLLDRYQGYRIRVVYEAGYFGFWLHDRIVAYGAECVVTPPSLIPQEYGNHVKTDRKDSRKLAYFLAKGLLKRVWVPSEEGRYHRQVVRRRRQLVGDRVRVQNRIKAELRFYGIDLPDVVGKWTRGYVENLRRLRFNNRWMQESFQRLLEEYDFVNKEVVKQTKVLRELAETELYKDRVEILRSTPGIGLIAAMEYLLELQDVERFRRSEQLAAYVGLTPSQYSSADKVRMGRITAIGKNTLRGTMVEVAWRVIAKDPAMREKYDGLKARCGSKRAIVAIARTVLLRTRRMLIDRKPYVMGLAA